MKQFDMNVINSIPFIDRARANDIALTILSDDFDLNPVLGFLPFFDSEISNRIFDKALKQSANIEPLLMAINPFTDKAINDIVTSKAMKDSLSAEAIIGKVFPFVSLDIANDVAEYAMKRHCNAESLINAAMPFVNRSMADKIVLYAIEKGTNPEFLSMKVNQFISEKIRCDLNRYLDKRGYTPKLSDNITNLNETTEATPIKRLERIFRESGIVLDIEKPDDAIELDSLHYISIICEMENEFDIEIPNEVFSENMLSSFNDFLKLLSSLKED